MYETQVMHYHIDISVLSNMQKQQKVAEKINKRDPGFEILIETIEKKTIYVIIPLS